MGVLWDVLIIINVSALVLLTILVIIIHIWDNCQRRILSNSRHVHTGRKTTKKEDKESKVRE